MELRPIKISAERKPVSHNLLILGSGYNGPVRTQVCRVLVRSPQARTNNRHNHYKHSQRRTIGKTGNPKIPKPGNKTFPPYQGRRAPQKLLTLALMELD